MFAAGDLDNNIAAFPVLSANSGVNEFYNGLKLSQVFPNPAVDAAKIQYSLEKDAESVDLVVYEMTGKKVYSETAKNQKAGSYTVNLNTSSLSAGTYFYQLRANGYSMTKEFAVTK